MNHEDAEQHEKGLKQTWTKPEITELKTSLTEKTGVKSTLGGEGPYSRPS